MKLASDLHTPHCDSLGCRYPTLQAGMGGVARAKVAGCLDLYQVGALEDALAAEEAGADVIIAQGGEAGGHVRGTVSSLGLLPQVVRAVHPGRRVRRLCLWRKPDRLQPDPGLGGRLLGNRREDIPRAPLRRHQRIERARV